MNTPLKLIALILIVASSQTNALAQQQPFNLDPTQSYVSASMPATPEAAAFDKYGTTQVNEFTGTTNISIPIYTLKSRFLQAPISLNYQASGIRVNQEASWVGLGWDLTAGGGITREIRGAPDFQEAQFCSSTFLATSMQQIFSYYGGSGDNAILTPATIATFNDEPTDPNIFNWTPVEYITEYGIGEPDIFRANFMGHSLSFYFDKTSVTQYIPSINPQPRIIGEQSTFKISYTLTPHNNNLTSITITDNDGVQYLFDEVETTTNSYQPGSSSMPGASPTSWLLTKVTHPSGDYIQFSYANYGNSVPAFTMSGVVNWHYPDGVAIPINPDLNTNVSIQSPYYLTQMATSDVTVNFNLGTRTDLYGPGSRELNSISVVDNTTGTIKKTAVFNYSYFQATPDMGSQAYLTNGANVDCYLTSIDPTLSQTDYIHCSNTRLRLDAVTVATNNNAAEAPYQFAYNPLTADKYTLSQDHWGYYNQVNNSLSGNSFTHLIPYYTFGNQTVQNSTFLSKLGGALGSSRECNSTAVQAMMLTKITYPTGGSTQFTYEPHQSKMMGIPDLIDVTGGGVRVKTIQNYAQGSLVNTTTYSYTGGKYMGTISYYTDANMLSTTEASNDQSGGIYMKLSSNGAANFDDVLVGYAQVTETQFGADGSSNGSIVKNFNVINSGAGYAYGVGYNLVAPYIPPQEASSCNLAGGVGGEGNNSWSSWLDAPDKDLPPTPTMGLEGKIMQEQYLDNAGNTLKSINYYYHLANYSNNFYDIRAIQNRPGNFGVDPSQQNPMNDGIGSCGNRPVIFFISPAKSYFTLTDSVVETDVLNGTSLISRKYYTYDNKFQVKSQQEFNSDGTSITTTFTHVYDYLANYGGYNSTVIQAMYGDNIITPVYTSTTTRNGAPVNFVSNYYYMPANGLYVPQYTQIQIGNNPLETREQYNQYDAYGHLMERQKPNGVKEDYLWGYDNQFPVASVVGSDINTVTGLVNAGIVNSPASDAALRTELNNLRTNLPKALVTTYTYDNVYGLTSATDPTGRTSYYNYDPIGRLSTVQDQDKNIIKRFCYNYAGEPDACPFGWGNTVQTGTFTSNTCPIGTSASPVSYSIPANTYDAIDLATANTIATNALNTRGQALANAQSCIAPINGTNTSSYAWNITMTNTATGSVYTDNSSFYPGYNNTLILSVPVGNYSLSLTSSTGVGSFAYGGNIYSGNNISIPNFPVNGEVTIDIQPWVGNAVQNGSFSTQGCPAGTIASTYPFSIPANTYYATSQTAADALATAALNSQGQAMANSKPCFAQVLGTNPGGFDATATLTNSATGIVNTAVIYAGNSGTPLFSLPTGTYTLNLTCTTGQISFLYNGNTYTGTNLNIPSFAINTATTITLQPWFGNAPQSGSFTSQSCPSGTSSAPVSFSIPINTYYASSLSAANTLATNALNSQGQALANTQQCIAPINGTNTSAYAFNVTLTNTSTGVVYTDNSTFYPGYSNTPLFTVPTGTYNLLLTSSAGNANFVYNGTTYSGNNISIPNFPVNSAILLTLSPANTGPCALSIASGFSSPTNGVTNNGSSTSFYMVFYSSSAMIPGTNYMVATITGACIPSVAREMSTNSAGRTWLVTVYPTGQVYWQMTSGTTLSAGSTVGGSTLTYAH